MVRSLFASPSVGLLIALSAPTSPLVMVVVELVVVGSGAPDASTSTSLVVVDVTTARERLMIVFLTWSGDRFGKAWMTSAASPETTAAAIDVPPTWKYWPLPTRHCGHSCV